MRFYLKTKNSVKGKTLVLHSVLKKVGKAIKKFTPSQNVFTLPQSASSPLAGAFSFLFATGSIFFTVIFYIFFYLF